LCGKRKRKLAFEKEKSYAQKRFTTSAALDDATDLLLMNNNRGCARRRHLIWIIRVRHYNEAKRVFFNECHKVPLLVAD
jgi:hypothetical protein